MRANLAQLLAAGATVGPSINLPPHVEISERAFQRRVIAEAVALGWVAYHNPDSRRSAPGWPDLEFVHPAGRYFRAELKAQKGRLRPEQERVIELLRNAGQTVYVWRPSDWPEIVKSLKGQST